MPRSPSVACFLVFAALLALRAQDRPAPPSPASVACAKDPSVDEYLREIHKRRCNKNPLPSDACIFGWCKETGAGNPRPEEPAPGRPAQTPATRSGTAQPSGSPGESSSAQTQIPAPPPPPERSDYDPIHAARSTEAGDYYFDEKNYAAALSRYQEALESKPGDAAIESRLGRAYEKLKRPDAAFEHYDASLVLDPAGPSSAGSREALSRLRPQLENSGADPQAIHARNAALSTPCRREAADSPR